MVQKVKHKVQLTLQDLHPLVDAEVSSGVARLSPLTHNSCLWWQVSPIKKV